VEVSDRLRRGLAAPSGPGGWGADLLDGPADGNGLDEGEVVRERDDDLAVGDRVRHPYFGEGSLAATLGHGAEARVVVDFDRVGRKTLLVRHARLERIHR
jgi:hypothetical protein